jgi:hypothetical protein
MFYIIERKEQLAKLQDLGDCFVNFIPLNNNFHPKLTNISLIYIRPINHKKGWIICIKHNEAFSLNKDEVINHLIHNTDKMFVLQKKETLYHFPYPKKLYDINFIKYINIKDNNIVNKCIDFYYKRHYNNPIINSLIPISKQYEEQENIFNIVSPIIHQYSADDAIYQFNNNLSSVAFHRIEEAGIALNKRYFIEQYVDNVHYPEFNISKGKIYTQYNLYTTTSRPSNRFNGINFAALNKTDNERLCYEPSNDRFIEMDFSGYHPRLIGELINYPLKDDNIYESLNVGKEEMFQNLYGGIRKEYKDKPFFKEASQYIDNVWSMLNEDGKIHTVNNVFYLDKIENPNPTKIFNYIIQSCETSTNVKIILDIIDYLKDKQTKLVLYTYDSILLDYSESDGIEIINKLKHIMKYPVKTKQGLNYKEMESYV